MNQKKSLGVLGLSIMLFAGACAPVADQADNALGQSQDSVSYVVESSTSVVSSILNDVEKTTTVVGITAGCDLSRFSPSIGSANCAGTTANKTVSAVFDSCVADSSSGTTLRGLITLDFDSSTTCDAWIAGAGLPTSGSVLRTMSGFTQTNSNGSTVTTDSSSHSNYLGDLIAGGVRTTFSGGAGSVRGVDILGLHRIRKSSTGTTVYDHSVYTTTQVVASGSKATNDRIVSLGQIRIDHNTAKYSATVSLSGIAWTSSCCHPSSGTLTFNLVGSQSGQITANFNTGTCGKVSVRDNKGNSVNLILSSCN